MSEITYPIRVICAHGTEQEWADANPILKKGEIGVSYDGSEGPRLKVGDGINEWNDLLWMVADVSATFDFADNFRIGVPNGGTGQVTFTSGFLKANGTNPFSTVPNIVENDLSFSDVTTGNASTTKHGFLPKLNNDDTYFLSGKGTWAVPEYMYPTGISGSSSGSVLSLSIGYRSNLSSDGITTSAYNLTGATDSAAGIVTTGAQTFAGTKTFNSGIVSNVTGDVTGNSDTSTTIRTVISTPSDLNSILTPGEYYIPQNTVQNTTLNTPSDLSPSDGLVVRVYEPVYTSGTSTYGLRFVQFAIGSSSGNVYVRTITRANTSSTFTYNSWKQLNFKSDIDNILNGTTTFAGTKTFTSSIIGNLTGDVTGNADTATMLNFTSVDTNVTSKDLNDYITPGLYLFENISSTNLLNSPVPEGYTSASYIKGFLEVFNTKKSPTDSNALVGFQRFIIHRYTSSDNKMAKTYIRGFSKSSSTNISDMTTANNFTPWKTFLDENDISSLETSITNITNGTTTVEYANKLKLTLLSSNSISANLNEVIEPRLYYGYYTTNPSGSGISHTNFPSDFPNGIMYYMYVNNYNYGNGTLHSHIIQRLYSKNSNDEVVAYIRNLSYDGSTDPATTSGTWLKIATNSDISNILTGNITLSGTKTFSSNIIGNLTGNVTGNVTGISDKATSLTYTEIPNENSNLNDYVASGLYVCVGSTSTVQNVPPRPTTYFGGIRFYMEVLNKNEPNANGYIGLQIFRWAYGNSNLNSIYYRQFNYSSGTLTFFDWIKVTDSIDFDPVKNNIDNILDGNTTFAGTKTFSSNIVGNLTGNSDTSSYLKPINITSSGGTTTDLNDYTYPGLYYFNAATSSDPVHSPIPSSNTNSYIRLYLEVFKNNPSATYSIIGFQRATYHWYTSGNTSSVKTYIRGFCKSSDNSDPITFTSWKLILDETDISSLQSSVSNILDGTTTFAGDKTFSSTIIGNITGNSGTTDRLKLRYIVGTSQSCDLNTVIEPGLHYGYYASSPSTGITYSNFPSDFGTDNGNAYIYLYVDNYNYGTDGTNSNQNGIIQRLYSKKTGDIYIRGLAYDASQNPVNITENSWTKIAKSSEVSTLSGTVSSLSTSLSTLSTGLSNRGIYSDAKNVGAGSGETFDFNNMTNHGMYYLNSIDGTISNKPTSSNTRGWLFVHHGSGSSYCFQMFITAISSPTKSTVYYRYKTSSWTSWFKLISDSDSTFLDNITFLTANDGGVDLNNYKNQGVYGFVGGNVTGTGAANFPTNVGGTLFVFGNGGTNVSQIYMGVSGGGMWYRSGSLTGSTPPTWKALIDGDRNKITEVSKTGVTTLKLPNYPARTYEYCVYEFNNDNTFSNMFCGSAAGNVDMTGGTAVSSKLYKGWYRRIF